MKVQKHAPLSHFSENSNTIECLWGYVKCTPGFAQEVMEDILRGIGNTDVYLDNIGCFPTLGNTTSTFRQNFGSWANRLAVNPRKCKLAVQETNWLGYLSTSRGLKPWKKKVNYYRDMLLSRAHVLKPLTDLSGLKKRAKIKSTPEKETAFKKWSGY